MKKIIGLTLVLALAFQCFSKLGLFTLYHFYKEYVIEEYCENKNQPQLRCEGTCFLKKALEKSDNNPTHTSDTRKQIEIPAFIISSSLQASVIFIWFPKIFRKIDNSYLFSYASTPFQPPKN